MGNISEIIADKFEISAVRIMNNRLSLLFFHFYFLDLDLDNRVYKEYGVTDFVIWL